MELNDLLIPITPDFFEDREPGFSYAWGRSIQPWIPDLDVSGYHLALVGVPEDRSSIQNRGCASGANAVRAEFYRLMRPHTQLQVIDFGQLKKGETVSDTYAALAFLQQYCLQNQLILIVLGGSHDLTIGQIEGFVKNNQVVNMALVDERMDIHLPSESPTDQNFLLSIFTRKTIEIESFCLMGYQTYFLEDPALQTLERLNFDSLRLGALREDPEEAEPYLRNANLVSCDVSCLKALEAPGVRPLTPNGFYAEEWIQLMRFAGLSDKVQSLGLYGCNPEFDHQSLTAQILAQGIWYFAEGIMYRNKENPAEHPDQFYSFTVLLDENGMNIQFMKSRSTNRWWMVVPHHEQGELHHLQYIPCSYQDYLLAQQQDIPERYIKASGYLMKEIH